MRRYQNEEEQFSREVGRDLEETWAVLSGKRKKNTQEWNNLDQGWRDLDQRVRKLRIAQPFAVNEGMVRLNVGGSHVNFCRSSLEGMKPTRSTSWTFADLFAGEWDKNRIPRGRDGRVLLDASPACVTYLLHTMLEGQSETGTVNPPLRAPLATDQTSYLPYVAHALGLTSLMPPVGMVVTGESTILEQREIGPLTAAIQELLPESENRLAPLYQASRDGWDADSFHGKCGNSPRP